MPINSLKRFDYQKPISAGFRNMQGIPLVQCPECGGSGKIKTSHNNNTGCLVCRRTGCITEDAFRRHNRLRHAMARQAVFNMKEAARVLEICTDYSSSQIKEMPAITLRNEMHTALHLYSEDKLDRIVLGENRRYLRAVIHRLGFVA